MPISSKVTRIEITSRKQSIYIYAGALWKQKCFLRHNVNLRPDLHVGSSGFRIRM